MGNRGYPTEHYQAVADIYKASGHKTTVAIAAKFNVPLTTAARWVKEARRRGLLGPKDTIGRRRLVAVANYCGIDPETLRYAIKTLADGDMRIK